MHVSALDSYAQVQNCLKMPFLLHTMLSALLWYCSGKTQAHLIFVSSPQAVNNSKTAGGLSDPNRHSYCAEEVVSWMPGKAIA